jgi:hypothetical protein
MGGAAASMLLAIKTFIISLELAAIAVRLLSPTPLVYAMRIASEHDRESRQLRGGELSEELDLEARFGPAMKQRAQRQLDQDLADMMNARFRKRAAQQSNYPADSPFPQNA